MVDTPTDPAVARHTDPAAVAAGNASLLGIGYLLIGRRALAVGTTVVTVVLVVALALSGSGPLQVVVLLWWLALIGHGWWSGRRRPVRHRRARWIALVPAIVVLTAVGALRANAAVTTAALDEARARGDCAAAVAAVERSWAGSRPADAPAAARADDTLEACRRIGGIRDRLDAALRPDVGQLGLAFREAQVVLGTLPGHERMVDVAFDGFLARVPDRTGCTSAAIVDGIAAQPVQDGPLRRVADAATGLAPDALVECGDEILARNDFTAAIERYRPVVTRFPGTPQARRARAGIATAEAELRAADARRRLPSFCATPFAYPDAPAPGPGVNRAAFFPPGLSGAFADWAADDVVRTALVVCLGDQERGSAARTCTYVYGGDERRDVTFHRAAFPIRVYELRTGQPVLETRAEIGDPQCPDVLRYRSAVDVGPPDQDTEVSEPDRVALQRRVLEPLIVR